MNTKDFTRLGVRELSRMRPIIFWAFARRPAWCLRCDALILAGAEIFYHLRTLGRPSCQAKCRRV